MKMRYATGLTEALATDINQTGDYIEDALKLVFRYLMEATSGVIYGLDVTQTASGTISVTSGAIMHTTFAFGELEAASGVAVTIPADSDTHTYTVTARYEQVLDSATQGYKLIDTETRTETTVTTPRRRFGGVIIDVAEDTLPSGVVAGRIPLATLSVTSGGIQSVDTSVKVVSYNAAMPQNGTLDDHRTEAEIDHPDASVTTAKLRDFAVKSTNALDVELWGGVFHNDNVVTTIASATVSLTDNATNYVEISSAGAFSVNTTGFTSGAKPLHMFVVADGAITNLSTSDKRSVFPLSGGSGGGASEALIWM